MRTGLLIAGLVAVLAVGGYFGYQALVGSSAQITQAAVEPDGENALRGEVTFRTDEPAHVRITVESTDHAFTVEPTTGAANEHRVPLLGLRAEHDYAVSADLLDADGDAVHTRDLGTLSTGSLPDDLPPVEVDVADPGAMTPGLTLFNSVYRPPPQGDALEDRGFLQAVDETGEIVWYHREHLAIQDASRMDSGDLLFISDETGARRITPAGEVVAEWRGTSPGTDPEDVGAGLEDGQVIEVPVHSMHHGILELDDGNLVTLSRVLKEVTYEGPPCEDAEGDEGQADVTANVVGDSVVVFDPETGEVLAEHSMFDVLDPLDDPRKTPGDLCLANYMERHYPEGTKPRDWTHANGVIPIDDGRTWLVSNRHTDNLVAIRAEDEPEGPAGSLRWVFGPDSDFTLLGDGDWFWHQHAPELGPDGTILLYDNGNERLDAPESYSRAVRYRIDPAAQTAEQVWEHRTDPDVYASFLGDADGLDDTVLITHGGLETDCETVEDETFVFGRLIEVEEASGEIVFDLTTRDDATCAGWSIYRAERIATIYPPDFEVETLRVE